MSEYRFEISDERAPSILELLNDNDVFAQRSPQATREEQKEAFARYIAAYQLHLNSLLQPNPDPAIEEKRLQRYPELVLEGPFSKGVKFESLAALRITTVNILSEPTTSNPMFLSSKGPQYASCWETHVVQPRFGYALISRFGLVSGERKGFREVAEDIGLSVGTARIFVKEGLAQFSMRFLQAREYHDQ